MPPCQALNELWKIYLPARHVCMPLIFTNLRHGDLCEFQTGLQNEFLVTRATQWDIALSPWIENPLLLCFGAQDRVSWGVLGDILFHYWAYSGGQVRVWVSPEKKSWCNVFCSSWLELISRCFSSPKVLFPYWILDGGLHANPGRPWWGGSSWWWSVPCCSMLAFRSTTTASGRLLNFWEPFGHHTWMRICSKLERLHGEPCLGSYMY